MLRPHSAVLILLIFLFSAPALQASQAQIDELVATAADDAVSVRITLSGAFEESWRLDVLQNGQPLVFLYQLDLIRKRKNWFDSIVRSTEIEIVATYNSLTREYLLNYRKDRKLVSSESVRSLQDLQRKMTVIFEERAFLLEGRNPRRLRVRARSILGQRYLLHIIPKPVSTDWETVRVQEPTPR